MDFVSVCSSINGLDVGFSIANYLMYILTAVLPGHGADWTCGRPNTGRCTQSLRLPPNENYQSKWLAYILRYWTAYITATLPGHGADWTCDHTDRCSAAALTPVTVPPNENYQSKRLAYIRLGYWSHALRYIGQAFGPWCSLNLHWPLHTFRLQSMPRSRGNNKADGASTNRRT